MKLTIFKNKIMKTAITLITALLLTSFPTLNANKQIQEMASEHNSNTACQDFGQKPITIFDGKTFKGWKGDLKTFRIENGCIVGGNLKNKIPQNEFLCTTRSYKNFILSIECKLISVDGKVNAGVQFRSKRIPDNNEVIGYQADMTCGKDGGLWGYIYDESRRRTMLAKPINVKVKNNDWNTLEIRCEGPRIRLFINGIQTTDYTETDNNIPDEGIIGLQIHAGEPSEAWYRNITIEELL